MIIRDLFERRIDRNINGVVKADQLDASSVWQELEEFVVTRELIRHFSDLVAVLLATAESEVQAADKNGVWISGFFGCGKSHLLKVLSYLLENKEHEWQGERRQAVDFFRDKFDPLFFADLKRATVIATDTILFNIDTKADHRAGRDTLLQVFLKVLNEKQGYSGDYPHIAHMERYLEEKGKLGVFHDAFERAAGVSWLQERDAWDFYRDQVIIALTEALGQSADSVAKWVDKGEDTFSLTVENFAKWVKQYLDRRGKEHRLMFLVDEVGQFVGNDTHLMLNLQTITEQLGTLCGGRAWVVVTSQEDLDAVLGDLISGKQHDFSKIQGRFKTRLSLSSANVDEVIKKRLLMKSSSAQPSLIDAYEGKHDILRNQLSFVNAGMSFKTYADVEDFSACYPFTAYQFTLVQKVFESIRKAGATGLHLSQGERSTLEAFQNSARQISNQEIGVLVPFYDFYPAVEGFLDTAVKRTIEQASENHTLQAFDIKILQVLFLIRYIDELPANMDNLVTLCIDQIDADRLSLRKKIEGALERLEGQTLIARNGDLYFFLTNEERDIGREIKKTPLPEGAEEQELGKLLFEDILGGVSKHRYSVTSKDFSFNRSCDGRVLKSRIEGNLEVAFVSPLGGDYLKFSEDAACLMHTSSEQGKVLIRLPDDSNLGRELRTYIQTELYLKNKQTDTLPENSKRILRDRGEENRGRRHRLLNILQPMLAEASYFASGNRLEIKSNNLKTGLEEALDYLIQNAYPKMGYIQYLHPNPKQEIQSLFRANDVEQVSLALGTKEANQSALNDLREYILLCSQTHRQIILHDLIEKRYGGRPYGWPELEVVLLVARLSVLKEIELIDSTTKAPIPAEQAYDFVTSPNKQRRVLIVRRETAGGELIKQAQNLGKDLFTEIGPNEENSLFLWLQAKLKDWNDDLSSFETLAKTGYPGLEEISEGRDTLRPLVQESNSLRFLQRFVENRDSLSDLEEDYHDLKHFYTTQKSSWDKLREAVNTFNQNSLQLNPHPEAGLALGKMKEILNTARPYGSLHQVAGLIDSTRLINDQLIKEAQEPAIQRLQEYLQLIKEELAKISLPEEIQRQATAELERLLADAQQSKSIAHIRQAEMTGEEAFERAMTLIEKSHQPSLNQDKPVSPVKPRRVVEPKALCSGLIENQEQVDQFLTALRQELETAIAANERVQIK